ncbi:MAG: TonB-dependent receptor, partial [Rhodothermales bacterium]|nr:TonB-dependent receptor [Rhodothermales bacterium]
LENIVTTKSFTPDKPGSFVGGNINITTRTFPETFQFTLSSSLGYNAQVTGRDNFLTYPGAEIDFLTFNKPGLAVPALWQARPENADPLIGVLARNDPALAAELNQLAKSFSPVMAPVADTAPVDRGLSASIGSQFQLFGRPLGFHGGVSYDENYSFYDDGAYGEFKLTGPVAEKDELDAQVTLSDQRGVEEVLLGGLGTLSYKLTPTHILSGTYMYNRSAESLAQFQVGSLQRDLPSSSIFETRVLGYTERLLQSLQFSGEHFFEGLGGLRAEWTTSFTHTTQEEPDLRFFANQINVIERSTGIDSVYAIRTSNYTPPSRYFRDLEEDAWDARLDLTLPLAQSSTVKVGGAVGTRERLFDERLFVYELNPADARYDGDPGAFFGPMTGVIDTTRTPEGDIRRLTIGNYIQDATTPSNNYAGDQQIYAAYGMVDLRLIDRLRVITGVRFEATRIEVASEDAALPMGVIDENDVLPSLNLVYALTEQMNLRAAYGRTLARPVFRELAPYSSFEFIGGRIFIGNPELERTLVNNFDLRWEWFTRPGEILAVSGFYKQFDNPIELAIVSTNNQVQYQNVETAQVLGIELEGRKRLDVLTPALAGFEVGGNLSLVQSQVDIPEEELEEVRVLDPGAGAQRALQGQSPYVLNLDVSYTNYRSGTTASLFYNVFGRRLAEVSIGGTPDVYEASVPTLDVVVSQDVGLGIRLKASAKNLLDPDIERVYRYKGTDFLAQSYQRGRAFSLSLTYRID